MASQRLNVRVIAVDDDHVYVDSLDIHIIYIYGSPVDYYVVSHDLVRHLVPGHLALPGASSHPRVGSTT